MVEITLHNFKEVHNLFVHPYPPPQLSSQGRLRHMQFNTHAHANSFTHTQTHKQDLVIIEPCYLYLLSPPAYAIFFFQLFFYYIYNY